MMRLIIVGVAEFAMEEKTVVGWLEIGAVALITLAVTLVLRQWMLSRLKRYARTNPRSMAGSFASDLSTPSLLWCLIATLDSVLRFANLSGYATGLAHLVIGSFLILSFTLVASSTLVRMMQRYGEQHAVPFAVAGLSRTLTQVVVFAVGVLVLASFLGVSITPLLATLGVGGLAVALALQDTLANLFAGIHLLVERPIAVGDFVRFSADDEGTVSDIGWRTTRVLTGSNNTIVIPNKNITTGTLLNYSMPEPRVGASVPIILGLDADISRVEQIAVECAMATEGVLHEFAPLLLADPGMLPTHLQYKLAFQIPAQTQGGLIKTRIVNAMLKRFREEGVPLPDPARFAGRG